MLRSPTMIRSCQNPAHGSAADTEAAGDLGYADAGTVQFPDLTGLLRCCPRASKALSSQPRFGNARANPLAQNLVL
jgi:hypothetical protein